MPLNILNPLRNAIIFSLSGSMLPLCAVPVSSRWLLTPLHYLLVLHHVYTGGIPYGDGTPAYAAPSKCEGQARDCWMEVEKGVSHGVQ